MFEFFEHFLLESFQLSPHLLLLSIGVQIDGLVQVQHLLLQLLDRLLKLLDLGIARAHHMILRLQLYLALIEQLLQIGDLLWRSRWCLRLMRSG